MPQGSTIRINSRHISRNSIAITAFSALAFLSVMYLATTTHSESSSVWGRQRSSTLDATVSGSFSNEAHSENRLADSLSAARWNNPFVPKTPSINTTETANEVRITATIPAVAPERIAVRIQDDAVVLSTKQDEIALTESPDGTGQEESTLSSFQAAIPLPSGVKRSQMTTTVHGDVLTVVIPKS